jgi:hypothetical protein
VKGFTLDASALIGFDRGARRITLVLRDALASNTPIAIPAGAVGQAWRDGRKQARLARLLATETVEIEALDARGAREAGQLCGARRTSDIVDASVILCAKRRGHTLLTSDTTDMRSLDPSVRLEKV